MPVNSGQTVTVTLSDGKVQIQIGPTSTTQNEGYQITVDQLKHTFGGLIKHIEKLIHQFAETCRTAGVDPHTATPAQIKAAIEAGTYTW